MIDYISGKIAELTPTRVVLDNSGIGYAIEISLQTYAALESQKEAKVYIYHHIQSSSDVELFYGFSSKDERSIFELLISVSGVGVNTARVILSSFSADELREAILSENVAAIKSVKGIGLKTAQRMVLELKDKISKGEGGVSEVLLVSDRNAVAEEAAAALQMLGFSKPNISKAIQKIVSSNPNIKVEELIKQALQML
ncbi:MAG: Holliday junction branch migration protein RuvA [Bacteroidales bacterium]|nr:Holliday junction branch migration protein RuvA [Bacteroidales bacterium]MDY5459722.1 Holliday junction branch migration protein RuvA [Candidatus Cryptobacteroides sp.]MEE0340513.1 Holliday junction branch migration protein RuvA [Bacteroidales bacterium]